jgi:Zn-dependent protease
MDVNIAHMAAWYVVFVFSTTFHEFAHAFVAYRGGDLTAYEGGQLSLDPLPHMRREPWGMILVPLLSFVFFGWMIGWASVPFDPHWGRRHPVRQGLMSLAGPLSNLLLALIAFGALRALLASNVFEAASPASYSQVVEAAGRADSRSPIGAAAMVLSIMLNLNVLLCLFNLIPIPPLDGAGVVEGFFNRRLGPLYDRLRDIPMMGLLGLVIAWNLFKHVADPAFHATLALLHPHIQYR